MTLKNDSFIAFDGTPITGRTPTQLIILAPDGTELTQMQYSAVCHLYKLFCDAVKVSPAEFHVQNKLLKDGTRVRMESNCGIDRVMVWPSGGGEPKKLPHGFVVKANWLDSPFIYKRVLDEDGALVGWQEDGDPVPQAKKAVFGYEQYVAKADDGETWVTFPLVAAAHTLWDYWKHKGATALGEWLIPANLVSTVTQANTHKNTIFVSEDTILDSKDVVLHTLAQAPAITYDDSVKPLPAVSTGDGRKLLAQNYRFAVISPTMSIWQYRFISETITNASENRDLLLSASVSAYSDLVMKPSDAQTYVVVNENSATIGEDVANEIFLNMFVSTLGGSFQYARWYWNGYVFNGFEYDRRYNAYWGIHEIPLVIPGDNNWIELDIDDGYESVYQEAASEEEYKATVRFTDYSGVVTCSVVSKLAYPRSKRWRSGIMLAGFKKDLASDAYNYYGVLSHDRTRRDSQYSLIGTPEVWITSWETEANKLKVFEGPVNGVLTGNKYKDHTTFVSTLDYLEWSAAGYLLCQQDYPGYVPNDTPPRPPGTPAGYFEYGTESYQMAVVDDAATVQMFEELRDIYGEPPYQKTETTLDEFNPPSNSISYDLTSRYVIDYDHRARFWAAIKVRVVSTGALWGQKAGSYDGHIEKKADPSYTITISFESAWHNPQTDSVARETILLTTASCTRPMFEAVANNIGNPYLIVDSPLQPLIFYMPPTIAVPGEAGTMFKNLGTPQGANPHFVGMDWINNTDVTNLSHDGIEYSYLKSGLEIPYYKRVTGMLYARKFKLSDISDALWLLSSTRCDAPLNDTPGGDPWYYLPELAETINTQEFHIELRDGVEYRWSDDIRDAPPVEDRQIKLYQV